MNYARLQELSLQLESATDYEACAAIILEMSCLLERKQMEMDGEIEKGEPSGDPPSRP